jgi:hypothetical protein
MTMRSANVRYSADPDDVSAQIDLLGVPRLMIGVELSAAPSGGSARRRRRVNIAG